ncbi:hypothetical protein L2E82_49839 [Cichorium intybus]|uniref:Uncharacterized protein n=1 Tax=Cichorium intybus TaxID=13427 RepID=A0ACB8Z1L3_CICIN|nr:hypothetical protein L2E82_49839 [Cichorium intybus]
MENTGEGSSYSPEGVSIHVLKNQLANLYLRQDTKIYPKPIDALVECLKHSILAHALTYTPSVPATLVYRAHYTSIDVINSENVVESVRYEVLNAHNTTKRIQLSKSRFAKAMQLPIIEKPFVPTNEQLLEMFNEMVYDPKLTNIGSFKKRYLPDLWKFFFSIFLCCLSGRTSGQDSTSQTFLGLLYGIYYNFQVDFVSILWTDFFSQINHSMKGIEISNARFWAMIVHEYYQRTGFVYDPSLPAMKYSYITIPVVDENSSEFCAQIPNVILAKVQLLNDVVDAYQSTLIMPYPTRPSAQEAPTKVPQSQRERRKSLEDQVVRRTRSEDVHGEEEEEHQSSLVQDTRPPSPPPTTAPPTFTITT